MAIAETKADAERQVLQEVCRHACVALSEIDLTGLPPLASGPLQALGRRGRAS
jgi:hypothetical protein